MKWINRLYIIFLGIILSITTGFGVAAFYPQPTSPNYYPTRPISQSCTQTPQSQLTPECQKEYDQQTQQELQQQELQQKYTNNSAGYTRTAIFFGIVIGAIFAVLGIGVIKFSKLVANGLLFGAVLTAVLTRLLIGLASLGSSTTGTNGPDGTAYVEFGVLLLLSIVVIFVGLAILKELPAKKR